MDGVNWQGLGFIALCAVLVFGALLWSHFDHERDEFRSVREHRRQMRALRNHR